MDGAFEYEKPQSRRRFFGNLGKTLAVGLGVALVTSEPALAACDGIICHPYPGGGSCGGDPYCGGSTLCGGQCFHCTGCGDDFMYCTSHTCTTWCFTPVC
jgi:hypothetical protein